MSSIVAVVRYQETLESVKQAVDLSRGLEQVKAGMRVVKDMVIVLKERG
jgi:uncharacterized protein (DUF362 family)